MDSTNKATLENRGEARVSIPQGGEQRDIITSGGPWFRSSQQTLSVEGHPDKWHASGGHQEILKHLGVWGILLDPARA